MGDDDGDPSADGCEAAARRLIEAPLEVVGRFADASNATLLVRLIDRDERTLAQLADELGRDPDLDDLDPADLAVYKPRRGDTPLWDFPSATLHRREVAAYEVAAALGWDLVPVTVLRHDAPFGVGSVQRFVAHDPERHYFALLEEGETAPVEQLRAMVLLDLIIDNADRKGGHVLIEAPRVAGREDVHDEPRVRLVDHGVAFNVERKLRTVGWHFADEPVPDARRRDVARLVTDLDGEVGASLAALLSDDELEATRRRAERVAHLPRFPEPTGPRPFPWPML